MGVQGLWRLIEPSGKPVPLESLENKILAVDVSIWLHQFIKGFRDNKGANLPNAHLLGIYHRVCKLLYFRIKPVFVFDGGVPVLKKRTIALRNKQKQKSLSEADRIQQNLLTVLSKHGAISKVLSDKATAAINASISPIKSRPPTHENLFVLPPQIELSQTQNEDSPSSDSDSDTHHFDLHSIDTQSVEFKSLPIEVRHEILTDLKETRKQSSWGRIHELPKESNNFSSYQMDRLLKRQSVQAALEVIEQEMGGTSLSLMELEKILNDQGVITDIKGSRIASDENTRFLLLTNIKEALAEAKKLELETIEEEIETKEKTKGDREFEDDLKKAIILSMEQQPSTSKTESIGKSIQSSSSSIELDDFQTKDGDSDDDESGEESVGLKLTAAQSYMMEYSGLTAHEINRIISSSSKSKKKVKEEKERSKVTSLKDGEQVQIESIVEQDTLEGIPVSQFKIKERQIESRTESVQDVSENITIPMSVQAADEIKQNDVTDLIQKESNLDALEQIQEVDLLSDSSNSDFVDVEENVEKIEGMEVLIKPNEAIEDDIFKDVFENVENEQPTKDELPTTVETLNQSTEEIPEDRSHSLKNQIFQLIKDYSKNESDKLTDDQLKEMRENLRKEQDELIKEKSTKERLAGNITDQMSQEAQELLELFGVPYIIAPMEAEAQCAFLDLIDLTDGSITDDSDIWLFGGRTVYKNFFDQNKIVLEFRSNSIEEYYKLTRQQMILLAMLVGSDYTPGINGVGPVTAMEVLAAFPQKDQIISGLIDFRKWFKTGKVAGPSRASLRSKLKNVVMGENFPNPEIVRAYLEPEVETSNEQFSWGKLDVVGLIEFAKQKFGWASGKTEEILNPIVKRLEDTRIQKNITDYFKYEISGKKDVTLHMSKRVKSAVNRMGKEPSMEEVVPEKKAKIVPKKGVTKKKSVPKKKKKKNEEEEILKLTAEQSKKRVEEIHQEIEKRLDNRNTRLNLEKLHRKDVIPQRQREKSDNLKNKLKAIETFRKSKQGPGFVKKHTKKKKEPQLDASYLSESSSSD